MLRFVSLLIGAAASAMFVRERRIRRNVERLGAATLETLLDAIDANSPETGAHVRRVASYSLILGNAAGLDDGECHEVERVALFHDIGKLDGALSDIVEGERDLTAEDLGAVRKHPQRGADVLKPLDAFYPDLARGVLAHHERWDGSGYPLGLRGEEIPLNARIVMIADTFDAITHSRSYSQGQPVEAATKVIEKGRGAQFDPRLVDLFLSPAVQSQIRESMTASSSPSRPGDKVRDPSARKKKTPDINFRWRKQAPLPRREGR